ncbi:MAG: DUF4395 domain-containing protein [Bacteroidota bacterium]|nr:DUF4395 domain-containing protein [Bacteroidota bacterium]
MNQYNIQCPISGDLADTAVIRVSAILVAIIAFVAIYFRLHFLSLFLVLDFFCRATRLKNFSLLRFVSMQVKDRGVLRSDKVDYAPKKFAAVIGVVFSMIIFVFLWSGWLALAWIFGSLLIFCALLEGLFSVCLGCYIYDFLFIPKIRKEYLR